MQCGHAQFAYAYAWRWDTNCPFLTAPISRLCCCKSWFISIVYQRKLGSPKSEWQLLKLHVQTRAHLLFAVRLSSANTGARALKVYIDSAPERAHAVFGIEQRSSNIAHVCDRNSNTTNRSARTRRENCATQIPFSVVRTASWNARTIRHFKRFISSAHVCEQCAISGRNEVTQVDLITHTRARSKNVDL